MSTKEFRLPDPGEGLTEAEIVTWRVKPGDTVKVNDIVVEIETAKSLVELPIPFAGVVETLLVDEGQEVEVGTPIIAVRTEPDAPTTVRDAPDAGAVEPGIEGSPAPKMAAAAEAAVKTDASDAEPAQGKIGGTTATGRTAVLVGYGVKQTEAKRRPRKATREPVVPDTSLGSSHEERLNPTHSPEAASAEKPLPHARSLAKPPVRKLAKDLGIDLGDVVGSGDGGIVTRGDVEWYADHAGVGHTSATVGGADGHPAHGFTGGETRAPIKGVRKVMAQAMVSSAFTSPHVTEWVTVDVTATMDLVARLKKDKAFRDVRVSPLVVLAKAMCVAIRRHPDINSSWDEAAQEIVTKHYVNLGIAAATPRGLVVPNIKGAHAMTMPELATALGDLTATARDGRTQPADMAGGTITITNVGVFGVDGGTPIINPPEAAILAFGAVRRMPWVVDTDGVESIEPRWVTQLGLSFDHRHIDGELGSRFLADVAAILHDPAQALVWG